jgi:hypothetical protein
MNNTSELRTTLTTEETLDILKEYFPNIKSESIEIGDRELDLSHKIYTIWFQLKGALSFWTPIGCKDYINIHMFENGRVCITIWK